VLSQARAGGEGVGIWGQAMYGHMDTAARQGVAASQTDRRGGVAGLSFGHDDLRSGAGGGYLKSDIGLTGISRPASACASARARSDKPPARAPITASSSPRASLSEGRARRGRCAATPPIPQSSGALHADGEEMYVWTRQQQIGLTNLGKMDDQRAPMFNR
jgi:hypothetical protein